MDQHLGASITLSFGLVLVFAIVLYPPEPDRPSPAATVGAVVEPVGSRPAPTTPQPPVTLGEPLAERPTPADSVPAPCPAPLRAEPEDDRAEPKDEPSATPTHEAFTRADEGETLRDVAVRVYGSPDVVEDLWRLNRDLVGSRDDLLPAGTLLRTP
jgi:nucleoid-associated protein YgaU